MSLIACTLNYGYPVLIGDLLFTTFHRSSNPIVIPTFLGGVEEFLPNHLHLYPEGLRQKIYVINDNLCIATSGVLYEMRHLLECLRNYFKYHPTNLQNVERFISCIDVEEIRDSAYILMVSENKNDKTELNLRLFGEWHSTQNSEFEQLLTWGSGQTQYLEDVCEESTIHSGGSMTSLDRSISLNLMTFCKLLARERFSLRSIQRYWGGGLEMIYFNGKAFQKVDDITYVVWKGSIDANDAIKFTPFLIMNYKYYEDILVITCFDGKYGRYGILPIFRTADDINTDIIPKQLHFDSTKVCCIFIIDLPNGTVFTPSLFTENKGTEKGFVTIKETEDRRLEVAINNDLAKSIEEMALERWRKRKNE